MSSERNERFKRHLVAGCLIRSCVVRLTLYARARADNDRSRSVSFRPFLNNHHVLEVQGFPYPILSNALPFCLPFATS